MATTEGELLQDTADLDAANKDDTIDAYTRNGGVPSKLLKRVVKMLNIKRTKKGGHGVSLGKRAIRQMSVGISFMVSTIAQGAVLNALSEGRTTITDRDIANAIKSTDFVRIFPNVTVPGLTTPKQQVLRAMQNTRLGTSFAESQKALLKRRAQKALKETGAEDDGNGNQEEEEKSVEPEEPEVGDEDSDEEDEDSVSSKEDSEDEEENRRDAKLEKAERAKEKKKAIKKAVKSKGKGKGKKATKGKGKKAKDDEEEEEQKEKEDEELAQEREEESIADRAKSRKRKRSAEDEEEEAPAETEGRRYPKKQRKAKKD